MDGILNINKATGMTSHDVVAKIRKLLKQKRVGHAGTLDPAASGVLPICVGQGTRVAEYLSESGKAYQAEIVLGVVTDTYDSQGIIVRTASLTDQRDDPNEITESPVGASAKLAERVSIPCPPPIYRLDRTRIEEALQQFNGPQMQMPPRYSAIKIQGRPAYKLARAGEEIPLQPRPITISKLEILQWRPPRLTLAIECSKGTYVRSLAYDLGERLGCGAHLGALLRTRSGPFTLSESITLEELELAIEAGTVQEYLHPADLALHQYPALMLDDDTVERVLHGNAFKYDDPHRQTYSDLARVYDAVGRFLAIAQWDAERGLWQPKKVLLPYC
jgi:tRNA pseudouridine55 synthase